MQKTALDFEKILLLSHCNHTYLKTLNRFLDCLGASNERQKTSQTTYVGSAIISRNTNKRNKPQSDSMSRLWQNLQKPFGDGKTQRYDTPRNKRTPIIAFFSSPQAPLQCGNYLRSDA